MTQARRLRCRRQRGFDLQAVSREANGLVAIYVGRPTKWGNPFRPASKSREDRREAIERYRRWLGGETGLGADEARARAIMTALDELRGLNLACWCPLDMPCHADVLLELANR